MGDFCTRVNMIEFKAFNRGFAAIDARMIVQIQADTFLAHSKMSGGIDTGTCFIGVDVPLIVRALIASLTLLAAGSSSRLTVTSLPREIVNRSGLATCVAKFHFHRVMIPDCIFQCLVVGKVQLWSGRPGSNRRQSAWKADTLPLSYSRKWHLFNLGRVALYQLSYPRVESFSRRGHKLRRTSGVLRNQITLVENRPDILLGRKTRPGVNRPCASFPLW